MIFSENRYPPIGSWPEGMLFRIMHLGNRASSLQLDIIVPVIMSCALLWWVSRGMSWTTRLMVTVVTLVLILCIVLFERSAFWSSVSP